MRSRIRKLVPEWLKKNILKLFYIWDRGALFLFSKTPRLAGVYYGLFSNRYRREHFAVIQGRVEYYKSLHDIHDSCALLRRNIHRLEKGLIMRPRRAIFGEAFIEETVTCYRAAISTATLCAEERKWARDVLEEYFSVSGDSKIIEKARDLYRDSEYVAPASCMTSMYRPYPHNALPDQNVTIAQIEKLFVRRRSVRWYKELPVSKEVVQLAANIASYAPSACNRQPYKFFFCNSPEKASRIAKCAGGTTGFSDNVQSIIAVVGDLSAYPNERDRHLIYIDGALATMQLILALETLGVSSCCINWPEVESSEKQISKIIDLKIHERIVMLVSIGYADPEGGIPYSQKKKDSLILKDISI